MAFFCLFVVAVFLQVDMRIGKLTTLFQDRRAQAKEPPTNVGSRRLAAAAVDALDAASAGPKRSRNTVRSLLSGKTHTGVKKKGTRETPTEAEMNKLCDTVFSLREEFGPKKISTYITDAIGIAQWKYSQSKARSVVKEKTKRKWLRNRLAPPLELVTEEQRLALAEKYGSRPEKFWTENVVFCDCKSFEVRTTARQKMLGRARTFIASYRTPGEGNRRSCLRPNRCEGRQGSESAVRAWGGGDKGILDFKEEPIQNEGFVVSKRVLCCGGRGVRGQKFLRPCVSCHSGRFTAKGTRTEKVPGVQPCRLLWEARFPF